MFIDKLTQLLSTGSRKQLFVRIKQAETRFYVFHTMRRIIAEINFPFGIYLIFDDGEMNVEQNYSEPTEAIKDEFE